PTTAKHAEATSKESVHPGVLPTLPTTTMKAEEKKEVAKVIVKRRVAPRAKPIKRKPAVEDNEIYESAEHMPTYPGGVSALMEFIKTNLQYPEDALAEQASGIIQVSFVVEKDGSTKEFEVIDEHHPSLEAEAVRVLQQMPKWTPATQDGVKVRVEYTVPVKFVVPEQIKEDANVNDNDNSVQD
ncbi:MAG: energy transducer TonB, partial [Bacteroidaceae bacterium]|nr:energy transducer TonB [Bacteroidaceae bacterium]